MLETLLIIAALNGNQESFNKSSEAYYKYQKLDVAVEKYGKEHPLLAHTVGAIGLVKEKKVFFQVQGPWFVEMGVVQNVAWFKKEF